MLSDESIKATRPDRLVVLVFIGILRVGGNLQICTLHANY